MLMTHTHPFNRMKQGKNFDNLARAYEVYVITRYAKQKIPGKWIKSVCVCVCARDRASDLLANNDVVYCVVLHTFLYIYISIVPSIFNDFLIAIAAAALFAFNESSFYKEERESLVYSNNDNKHPRTATRNSQQLNNC